MIISELEVALKNAEDRDRDTIVYAISQLRHLYSHLVNGTATDLKQLADGLLSPQIQRLERLIDKR